MSAERCDYEWPQTAAELARSVSDCPHSCRLAAGHLGDHRCCWESTFPAATPHEEGAAE